MQVDELARSLMPANLEALRGILHATAVEVLLWFGSWADCELRIAVATPQYATRLQTLHIHLILDTTHLPLCHDSVAVVPRLICRCCCT